VSFMDSEGLGVLVGAHRRLLGHQHDDRSIHLVCAPNGLVARILRLGLDRVFSLHASLADALGGDAGQADD
jgi:anti-anti-sigma regulatory factor